MLNPVDPLHSVCSILCKSWIFLRLISSHWRWVLQDHSCRPCSLESWNATQTHMCWVAIPRILDCGNFPASSIPSLVSSSYLISILSKLYFKDDWIRRTYLRDKDIIHWMSVKHRLTAKVLLTVIDLREAPPQKKRENVGILKKQGGGSTQIPLLL